MKAYATIMKYISLTVLIANTILIILYIYNYEIVLNFIVCVCTEIIFYLITAMWDMELEMIEYEQKVDRQLKRIEVKENV